MPVGASHDPRPGFLSLNDDELAVLKIIDRYLFREIALLFVANVAVLTIVLGLAQLLQLTDLVVKKGVPLGGVFLLLLYLLPSYLAVTLPMAQLVAIVMAFSRLATDSEITVLRASGVSLARLLRPMIAFSVAVGLVAAVFMVSTVPRSNHAFRSYLFSILRTRADVDLRPRVFNDYFPGVMLYVDEVERDGAFLRGVLIADSRNPKAPQTITADEGMLFVDPVELKIFLRLKDGSIHSWEGGKEKYDYLRFARYDLTLSFGAELRAPLRKSTREMTPWELSDFIQQQERAGRPTHQLRIEFQQKFALPFASLMLGLIGAPLGMLNRRSGRFGGMIASLAVILSYYLLLTAGKSLGGEGVVPAVVAAWSPNIFLGLIGSYLMVGVSREAGFSSMLRVLDQAQMWLARRFPKRFAPQERA